MCGIDYVTRNRYFGDMVISREEATGRVRNLNNGKIVGIDGNTGEMF